MSKRLFSDYTDASSVNLTDKLKGLQSGSDINMAISLLIPKFYPNYIENLMFENSTTTITVKAGLRIAANGYYYEFASDTVLTPTTIGVNGYKWCCILLREDTGVLSSDWIANFITISASTNQLNMFTGTNNPAEAGFNAANPGGGYDKIRGYVRFYDGTNYYRVIGVFKQIVTFVDSTVDTLTAYNFTCDSTANMTIGMAISGTDIPANSEIVEITSATAFRANIVTTGSHANINMTVANDIINIRKINKKPYTDILLTSHINFAVAGLAGMNYENIEFDLLSEVTTPAGVTKLITLLHQQKIDLRCSQDTLYALPNQAYIYVSVYKNSKFYCGSNGYAHNTTSGMGGNQCITEKNNFKKGTTLQIYAQKTAGGGTNSINSQGLPRNIKLSITGSED
jgi:hypothetical protein